MHILIDLQGAQSESRYRGIGRYSLLFSLALAKIAKGQHRIALLLNAAFDDTIEPLKEAFSGLVADEDIHLWAPLSPCDALDPGNSWRRAASEKLYNAKIRQLQPDWLLITSLFEGQGDDAVSAIGETGIATAVVLHDLIPLILGDKYLVDPLRSRYYHHQLAWLRSADLLLSNSDSTAREALDYLDWPKAQIAPIYAAADGRFRPFTLGEEQRAALFTHFGIARKFVISVGDLNDPHKNIPSLIAAYARLPAALRQDHQLVLVHRVDDSTRSHLQSLAARNGLKDDDVVLTGHVSDDDLVRLYNLCTLFVSPSLHEGFGLPALEAMSCGAPVLASKKASLPEVVGWADALFDPEDLGEMAALMQRALGSADFIAKLKAHGARQSQNFSWEMTAQRALNALHTHAVSGARPHTAASPVSHSLSKPLLAYVSPLQSAKSGIADYSAELLPELARHYNIEVVVQQDEALTDPWVLANARQCSVSEFIACAQRYDRVLYHIGNSSLHQHMFDLIERIPGVIVLHDFYLAEIQEWLEGTGKTPGAWQRSLLLSHGWDALVHRYAAKIEEVRAHWPCNFPVLQRSLQVIVHSEYSRRLAEHWYGRGFADYWTVIPHLRKPIARTDRHATRVALGLNEEDVLVCCFGLLNTSKLNDRLLDAWLASDLARDPRCKLVFVGEAGGEYGTQLMQRMGSTQGRVNITGWADEKTYRRHLVAADIAVQLRGITRGETSGTALDCMNAGLPTICNANGSLAELPHDIVWMLEDNFSNDSLVDALQTLRSDPQRRKELGEKAQRYIHQYHQPRACAAQYAKAIEGAYDRAQAGLLGITQGLRRLAAPATTSDLALAAIRATEQFPMPTLATRQLFFDISELHHRDAKTGIQRVVRSVMHELLRNPPAGYRIEPVYATMEHGYRYARCFTARFLNLGHLSLDDAPISAHCGDVFWAVDWQPDVVPQHQQALRQMRLRGVKVVFTVHDVLPLTLPQATPEHTTRQHRNWMQTLAHVATGLIAVSATVAQETKEWLALFGPRQGHPLQIGWAHNGADVVELAQREHQWRPSPHQQRSLEAIARYPAFLMVGTLEPRKGHAQVLAAFEWLWRQGHRVNLVIVGKLGWMVDALAEALRSHPERERHLFWLEAIGDDYLEAVYAASTCLIAASYGEGFGLPLVEAARHKLAILARDIPVFREVAGRHAAYFSGLGPADLGQAVLHWLERANATQTIASGGMPWLTWAQATQNMLKVVLEDQWQDRWIPKKDEGLVARYWGSDPLLFTAVGERRGTALWSSGKAGHLLYGPYLSLPPGRYVAILIGKVGIAGVNGAVSDICINGGKTIVAECALQGSRSNHEQTLALLEFTLTQSAQQVEVRVEAQAMSDLAINLLEIRRADALPTTHLPVQEKVAAQQPDQQPILAYWATHPALASPIGYAAGRRLYATGKSGHLLCGPYAELPAGRYRAQIFGEMHGEGEARVDVCTHQGRETLFERVLSGEMEKKTDGVLVEMGFELDRFVEDLEIRIETLGLQLAVVHGLILRSWGENDA